MRSSCASLAAALALAPAAAGAALPDEIQVYTSDINKPGEFGLELHLNTTPSGRSVPEFPGEVVPAHGWRFTPEFSYGLTPSLEGGFYLPFVYGVDRGTRFAGPKVRLKWMPLRVGEDGNGAFAGLNFEYAWISSALEETTRALEVRLDLGVGPAAGRGEGHAGQHPRGQLEAVALGPFGHALGKLFIFKNRE